MPQFSAFTPFGMMDFSSKPTHAEAIYESLVSNINGDNADNYSVEEGSREDAWCYATAMGLARAQYTIDAASNELNPQKVTWFLDDRENEYGIVPTYNEGLADRRASIVTAKKLPAGALYSNLIGLLSDLLGSDFVALRPTKVAERVMNPPNLGDQPMNLKLPKTDVKLIQLTDPVLITGTPITVHYRPEILPVNIRLSFSGAMIRRGDSLVIEPRHWSVAETVLVTDANPFGEFPKFTATFTKAHEAGVYGTTQPYPYWVSNQRDLVVVLKDTAAIDPEKRRKVNELMERVVRGVTTWSIVQATSASTSGPFVLDSSPLDATSMGALTFP